MKWVAVTLIISLGVMLTHNGVDLLAPSQAAREELFYVSRGFLGVILFGAIVLYAQAAGQASTALLAICTYGAVQEALTSVCGASYMLQPVRMTVGQSLCDRVTGWQPWTIFGGLCALLIAGFAWTSPRK